MWDFLQGTGYFLYPLGLCSLVGIALILERIWALRVLAIFPENQAEEFLRDSRNPPSRRSVLGRMIAFVRSENPDREGVRSQLRLEVDRMQRGLFMLDVIISVAPLLGLMGTVAGLVTVFRRIDAATGLPDPAQFTEGVALALSTTLFGLAIAIPCLMANAWFNRRIERMANTLDAWIGLWRKDKNAPAHGEGETIGVHSRP